VFGLGLDYLFSASDINPASLIHMEEEAGLIAILSSVVLWGLVGYLILKRKA
jgi:hypothetical protein